MITVEWIYHYYHDGLESASRSWQYPSYFSPSIRSILDNKNIHLEIGTIPTDQELPLTPIQALSAVLPIWLHDLIPDINVRNKLLSIRQYYPYGFDKSPYTKEPIIPIIPYEIVSNL